MNWYKISENNNIIQKIKDILKRHSFITKLMHDYNIPVEDIDNNLIIEITDLDGKFAEGNGKKIIIDKKLINDNFFKDNFHFVIHEFFHWLKRRHENISYFNDSEEIQSFVLAISWELINNKNKEEIANKIYPIIKAHFKSKKKPEEVFEEMFNKALDLVKKHQKIS